MKFCELELFEDCFDELVATRRNSSTPNLVDTSEMSVDDPELLSSSAKSTSYTEIEN